MKHYYLEYSKKIFKHGNYALPLLNYLLKETLEPEWKYYFYGIKNKWDNNYKKSIDYFEASVNTPHKNISLDYISFSELLILYDITENIKPAEKIYRKLKTEYSSIPIMARKIVAAAIVEYESNKSHLVKTEIKGRSILDDRSVRIKILRNFLKFNEQNCSKEAKVLDLLEIFRLSTEIPYPDESLKSILEIIEYYNNDNPLLCLVLSKKFLYTFSFYYESFENFFIHFDNILKIYCHSFNENYFEMKDFLGLIRGTVKVNYLKERFFLDEQSANTIKNHMSSYIDGMEKTGISRQSLSNIINNKTEINLSSLMQIIESLNIIPDDTYPEKIIYGYKKLNEIKKTRKTIEFLEDKSIIERKYIFLIVYSSLYQRKIHYKSLSTQKAFIKKSKAFIEGKYEKCIEIIKLFDKENPVLQARQELIERFLDGIAKDKKEIFADFYISLTEEKKLLLDQFIRNYSRYAFEIKNEDINQLKDFSNYYGLKFEKCIIAYYCFEEIERKKFIKIIRKI